MGEYHCANRDSKDQNPQVDTVLGEELTIHTTNPGLHMNVTAKKSFVPGDISDRTRAGVAPNSHALR